MLRAPRLVLAFLLATGVAGVQPAGRLLASSAEDPPPAQKATLKAVAAKAPDIPFAPTYEIATEDELLVLANQARRQAGAPLLVMDPGISQAARVHAQAMMEAHQLSHQFDGEPSLVQRVAATTALQLDQEGENVALDYDASHGHQHLMESPPHRANLLNPAFNVVGLGVVRSGNRLYIVQDFARALPLATLTQWKDRVASAVDLARRQAKQPEIPRRDLLVADDAACSMAKSDKLGTEPVHKLAERFTVLSYTSLYPENLPQGGLRSITSANLKSFSIGACYARTDTYPTGVYWVVLTLE